MKRMRFTPTPGEVYRLQNSSEYISEYKCLCVAADMPHQAILQSTTIRWTFLAKGIGRYENGTIDWDYSIGGRFKKESCSC